MNRTKEVESGTNEAKVFRVPVAYRFSYDIALAQALNKRGIPIIISEPFKSGNYLNVNLSAAQDVRTLYYDFFIQGAGTPEGLALQRAARGILPFDASKCNWYKNRAKNNAANRKLTALYHERRTRWHEDSSNALQLTLNVLEKNDTNKKDIAERISGIKASILEHKKEEKKNKKRSSSSLGKLQRLTTDEYLELVEISINKTLVYIANTKCVIVPKDPQIK